MLSSTHTTISNQRALQAPWSLPQVILPLPSSALYHKAGQMVAKTINPRVLISQGYPMKPQEQPQTDLSMQGVFSTSHHHQDNLAAEGTLPQT